MMIMIYCTLLWCDANVFMWWKGKENNFSIKILLFFALCMSQLNSWFFLFVFMKWWWWWCEWYFSFFVEWFSIFEALHLLTTTLKICFYVNLNSLKTKNKSFNVINSSSVLFFPKKMYTKVIVLIIRLSFSRIFCRWCHSNNCM